MGKTIEYQGQTYELNDNEVLAIKVALPRNQRTGKFRFKNFGKVEVHASWLYQVTKDVNRKKKQGHWGWMTVEDFEAKNFAIYGLEAVAKNMDAQTKAQSLIKENSSLQDEIIKRDQEKADLLAKIAELEGKKTEAVETDETNESKEEVVEPIKAEEKELKPKAETKVKPEKTEK